MKIKVKIFSLLCAVFMCYCSVIDANEHIRYAAVLFRHGDRTPVASYPTDPWANETLWPERFGQLTNTGKRQHFALGQWFRTRFMTLVSSKYDPTEMRVRSSDVDRTLMSAQTNLAGMFPPISKSIWNDLLMWQPIPVHTVPEKEDEVLAMKKPCYNYEKEKRRVMNSPEYKQRLSKYQKLMDYLSYHTGAEVKDYEDINSIYNVLFIEQLYNFTLPQWTKGVFPDKMVEPAGYSFKVDTLTPSLARLRVGPFFKEIRNNMVKIMHAHNAKQPHHYVDYDDLDGVPPLKLNIYSAHDLNIASVLNSLGLFDGKCPQYTATILFELVYDEATQIHFVRLSYRNTPEIVEPQVLIVPNCGYHCPLERFVKILDKLIPTDWEEECAYKVPIAIILMYLFNVVVILLVVLFNYMYKSRVAAGAARRRLNMINT